MNTSSVAVLELLSELNNRQILIPSFQRNFIWNQQAILNLLESIRNGIPLGALVLWKFDPKYDKLFADFPVGVPGSVPSINPTNSSNQAGILDGRQRSQALLMTLSGKCDPAIKNAQLYYLDLTIPFDGESSPFGSVISTSETFRLPITSWIRDGKLPLWYHDKQADFAKELANPANCANNTVPGDLGNRLQNMTNWFERLNTTIMACIELEAKYDLSLVCDVFEKINISGKKVSVFDITHATLFSAQTGVGSFDLRRILEEIGENANGNLENLSRWCNNPAMNSLWVQAVTMMYIDTSYAKNNFQSQLSLDSIKGEHVINTPAAFYRHIFGDGPMATNSGELSKLEIYAKQFRKATNGCIRAKECPYPIMFAVYMALRYKADKDMPLLRVEVINDIYRVYYWRSALKERYDQGTNNKVVQDYKMLWDIIVSTAGTYNKNIKTWWREVEKNMAGTHLKYNQVEYDKRIDEMLKSENSGAHNRMWKSMMYVRNPKDLQTNLLLSPDSDVDGHHIWPKQWVNDNVPSLKSKLAYPPAVVPMSRKSNNVWRSSSPEVILQKWSPKHTWSSYGNTLLSVHINQQGYQLLTKSGPTENDVEAFYQYRREEMKDDLMSLVKSEVVPSRLK